MQNIVYIILSLMVTELYSSSCIVDVGNREIVRNEFTFHETIQSEHFVIHFTTADVDSQEVFGEWYNLQSNFGYAQSIIDHLEVAYSIFILYNFYIFIRTEPKSFSINSIIPSFSNTNDHTYFSFFRKI